MNTNSECIREQVDTNQDTLAKEEAAQTHLTARYTPRGETPLVAPTPRTTAVKLPADSMAKMADWTTVAVMQCRVLRTVVEAFVPGACSLISRLSQTPVQRARSGRQRNPDFSLSGQMGFSSCSWHR